MCITKILWRQQKKRSTVHIYDTHKEIIIILFLKCNNDIIKVRKYLAQENQLDSLLQLIAGWSRIILLSYHKTILVIVIVISTSTARHCSYNILEVSNLKYSTIIYQPALLPPVLSSVVKGFV